MYNVRLISLLLVTYPAKTAVVTSLLVPVGNFCFVSPTILSYMNECCTRCDALCDDNDNCCLDYEAFCDQNNENTESVQEDTDLKDDKGDRDGKPVIANASGFFYVHLMQTNTEQCD